MLTADCYPQWVCGDCGDKYGQKRCGLATWHTGTCGVCQKKRTVTEPRDFGHLKDGWQSAQNDT